MRLDHEKECQHCYETVSLNQSKTSEKIAENGEVVNEIITEDYTIEYKPIYDNRLFKNKIWLQDSYFLYINTDVYGPRIVSMLHDKCFTSPMFI